MNGWNIAKVVIDVEAAKTEEAIQQKLIEMGWTPPHHRPPQNYVDRVEVIDKTGRAYTHYLKPSEKMTISMQDDNKTMKIFIGDIGDI